MIDRGALVLAVVPGVRYRGVNRPTLDAQHVTGRRGKELAQRYASAVVAGEGVIEDLDEAIALCRSARKIGLDTLEVVVFEVPHEPAPAPRALPVAPTPPAEGLVFMGHDVIELIEPYWSPLAGQLEAPSTNDFGLLASREDAEAIAARLNGEGREDLVHVVRVWTAPSADA